MNPGNPDPAALRVAEAVRKTLDVPAVLLFGSRARGDYRPDSDIDIMVPLAACREVVEIRKLNTDLQGFVDGHYQQPVSVGVVPLHPGRIRRMKHSVNDLTAMACREGHVVGQDNDLFRQEPGNQAFEALHTRWLYRATMVQLEELALARREGDLPALIGVMAGRAIYLSLQTILSAHGESVPRGCSIETAIALAKRVAPDADLETTIPLWVYAQYQEVPPKPTRPIETWAQLTATVRKDVRKIAANVPDLRRRFTHRKRRRRN